MRESLEKYKIVNWIWVYQYLSLLGPEEFFKFEALVNTSLDKLGINRYYDVLEVPSDNQELFIKFCCLYISRHPEYEFNEDFTQVWRRESYEQREMEARRRNLCARKRG